MGQLSGEGTLGLGLESELLLWEGTGGEAGILSSETWMEEAGVRAGLPHGKNKQAQFTHCWQGGRCWLW